jgi:hypothetical protein
MAVFKNAVGIPDQDAINFINATGITNPTQIGAINRLVLDLKGFVNPNYPTVNIWDKMKAVYPFVGGTADTHKFNLKDPRDANAAYRITWSVAGVTHSLTGVTFNGQNGYGSTKLIPSNNLTLYSNHISLYSRTSTVMFYAFSTYDDTRGGIALSILPRRNTNAFEGYNMGSGASISNTDASGFYLNTRTSNTLVTIYKNNTNVSFGTSTAATNQPTGVMVLGATSYNAGEGTIFGYSLIECAFASIGDGLTDTEAANFYTAVQRFQTTLGRQV